MNGIESAIQRALQESSQQIVADEISKCQASIEKRIRASAAEICANVVRHMTFHSRGDEIIVTLTIPNTKP